MLAHLAMTEESQLPQINVRLTREARERVRAMARWRGQSQSAVMIDAVTCLYEQHSPADRRVIDDMMRRGAPPTRRGSTR